MCKKLCAVVKWRNGPQCIKGILHHKLQHNDCFNIISLKTAAEVLWAS